MFLLEIVHPLVTLEIIPVFLRLVTYRDMLGRSQTNTDINKILVVIVVE